MLEIRELCKKAGDFTLCDISLEVKKGDYFVLLGVSGSGKSMLLELIAGITRPDRGKILLEGSDITNDRIHSRGIGLVFQDSAVFPHMTVFDNIAYPLKNMGLPSDAIKREVDQWAQLMGIEPLLRRRPQKLSGGELRRVALARTLAMRPKILLLDEPLSSMDVLLQNDLMQLLSNIHHQGQTIIHVTHDYLEAYALATKLAVMQEGRVLQKGTPQEVFDKPGSAFVAGLAGIRNYFQCTALESRDSHYMIQTRGITLVSARPVKPEACFYLRESDILFNPPQTISNRLNAVVTDIFPFPGGADVLLDAGLMLHAHLSGSRFADPALQRGAEVIIGFDETAIIPV